jgi:hypothetical protein
MDSLELSPIQAVSPTLAETIRGCQLRAGLSRITRSYDFVLGNPKAWLGTAYHEVLERIGDVDFSRESFDSAAERLWEEAVSVQYQRSKLHALDRRYGLPVTWPGYYVSKASAFLRAAELAANRFGEGSLRTKLDAKQSIREQKLTALDGKLVGRPDVIRDREIVDYKSGSILEQDEATLTEVVKAAYVRQLRIYGFLVKESLGYLPERGVLLPIAGAGVEIALDPDDCAREAVEAVAILDGYNARLSAASEVADLANPAPDKCKWCPFKLLCRPFWKSVNPDWSQQLDGAAVEGVVEEPPLVIQGGAAMAVSININTGSESSNRLQVAPLNPSTQLAATVAPGDCVRLVGLRTRNDGSVVPSQRTILARVEDLPNVILGHSSVR